LSLSDKPRAQLTHPKAKKQSDSSAKQYSDRQKLEAVTSYLMLGTIPLVAATLKLPEECLYRWKRTDWWHDLTTEIKSEENLVLSARMKKIVEKSWDVVSDRLDNGDYVYDQKAGQLIRKPVSLRDASKVAMDSAMLHGKLNSNANFTVANEQIEEKLSKLAKAFTDLAKGKPSPLAEDIPYIEHAEAADTNEGDTDAIHDRWETQLQEGESPL
jgi:hypothetical protein